MATDDLAITAARETLRHRRLWEPLRPQAEQQRIIRSPARFKGACAGVRSGKTRIAKMDIAAYMMDFPLADGFFVWAGPTYKQAKRIFWPDAKAIFPRKMIARISESDLSVQIVHGPTLQIFGMQDPERLEGIHVDGIILDELDDMGETLWDEHIRTRLSTANRPPGRAWMIGVPEGKRNLWRFKQQVEAGQFPDGDFATWWSEAILDPAEIAHAKATMDPLIYRQEYQAEFVTFAGQAYYSFDATVHARERVTYDEALPLHFCFDFNVDPGTAAVCQDQAYTGAREEVADEITAWIGEVWIRPSSNTPAVCRALLDAYGEHEGLVYAWGDYTGGARHSSQTAGTDWDQIKEILGRAYGGRLKMRRRRNPSERARVNAVNSRLLTADGKVHMLVDPVACAHLIDDFETVAVKDDGSGDLDKDKAKYKLYTHLTDEVGYFTYHRHPLRKSFERMEQIV